MVLEKRRKKEETTPLLWVEVKLFVQFHEPNFVSIKFLWSVFLVHLEM